MPSLSKKTKSKKSILEPNISQDEVIKQALYKKAMGYISQEIIEEYVTEDSELILSKRKVTSKEVPPDIPAVKTLIEMLGAKDDITNMTDEELLQERQKLLQLLQKENEDG